MRFFKSRPGLFMACAGLLLSSNTQSAWISAFGVPNVGQSYGSIDRLNSGGFVVNGVTDYSSNQVNWYARLDAQGQILWSKSLGNVHALVQGDGSVYLFEIQHDGNTIVSVSGTGQLNPATGDISNVVVEKNIQKTYAVGTERFYSRLDKDNIITGTVAQSPENDDAGVAKLDDQDNVVWSHRYDFGAGDNAPSLTKLANGYLLVFESSEYDPDTFVQYTSTILAKLNNDGTMVANSARVLTGSFDAELLADESVALVGTEDAVNLNVVKLDKQLNLVWGKRYTLTGSKGELEAYDYISEMSNGTLEIAATHKRLNEQDETIAQHPLQLRINPANGAIVEQVEFQVRTFDPSILNGSSFSYWLWGSTSDTQAENDQDGIIAELDGHLTPKWFRTLDGAKHDVTYATPFVNAPGYELTGNTTSWGAGGTNLLFGQLDKNGTVNGCTALHDVTPNLVDPGLVVADLTNPVSTLALADNGSFAVAVTNTEKQYSLTVTPADYPLQATPICSAADPNPTGAIGLSATELNFGNVQLKSKGTNQLTITNNGDGGLAISGISAPDLPFKKTSDNCSGKTLAAGASCTVEYQFSPTASGQATANVVISSNDPDHASQSFTLVGTGSNEVLSLQFTALSSSIIGASGELTITGQGFTAKKGKVLWGKKQATIVSWSGNAIILKTPKVKAGVYGLNVVTKTNGSVSVGQLTLSLPSISSADAEVVNGSKVYNIIGNYFGTGKPNPTVNLVLNNKSKALTVLPGYSNTLIRAKLTKKLKPGSYQLIVSNSAGKSTDSVTINIP